MLSGGWQLDRIRLRRLWQTGWNWHQAIMLATDVPHHFMGLSPEAAGGLLDKIDRPIQMLVTLGVAFSEALFFSSLNIIAWYCARESASVTRIQVTATDHTITP